MQFEIFASIDWSTKVHEVAVADAGGEDLGACFIIGASVKGLSCVFGRAYVQGFSPD